MCVWVYAFCVVCLWLCVCLCMYREFCENFRLYFWMLFERLCVCKCSCVCIVCVKRVFTPLSRVFVCQWHKVQTVSLSRVWCHQVLRPCLPGVALVTSAKSSSIHVLLRANDWSTRLFLLQGTCQGPRGSHPFYQGHWSNSMCLCVNVCVCLCVCLYVCVYSQQSHTLLNGQLPLLQRIY